MHILVQANTLQPGDKVLLSTTASATEELHEVIVILKQRFPGVEFTLMTEINGLYKYEGDIINVSDDPDTDTEQLEYYDGHDYRPVPFHLRSS